MPSQKEIQAWLIHRIATVLDVDPEALDLHTTFANFGLSSRNALTLSGDLETWLGRRLSPTLAYDYPTVAALAAYLAGNEQLAPAGLPQEARAHAADEPIAVVGLSCRFPGAPGPDAYWRLLCDGVDAIRKVPPDRWDVDAFYDPDPSVPGKTISRWGGFLDRVDQFDPHFFGISPAEAKIMDPQQRLLLELSYEALDDAGQVMERLNGSRTGVYVGISVNEYSQLQFADPRAVGSHSGTGSTLAIAANRISYFYNFHGPSMALDTACSSSLSAVHLACQSLRRGECRMALAGGVNLILSPAHAISFTKAGLLAPDGRCKTFDARADGYVRGEGGGLVVLKPLSAAMADGDPIHALILGSAMDHDGRSNGLMAPSQKAQEGLLRAAYRQAGVPPSRVQYVEAHGTGTLLGDSMEAEALGKVVGAERRGAPCAVGSVKSNIGHLESAAGIAGLLKVILSLKHQTLPPSLHYEQPNPHIPFDELNLRVQNELQPWPQRQGPALAGVSSFGFGGTIVHMVVREAKPAALLDRPGSRHSEDPLPLQILPLTATSPEALRTQAKDFHHLLTSDFSVATGDICHAAGTRRGRFTHRLAALGSSRRELASALEAFQQGQPDPNLVFGQAGPDHLRKIAFVFPGQGGQWPGMARDLLESEPVFAQAIQRIDEEIASVYGWSVRKALTTAPRAAQLDQVDILQPVLFAIQVALAELWISWGIRPDAVVGHSMGEVAAAWVAGILDLGDAIQVICERSILLKDLRGKGAMLVTDLPPDAVDSWIAESGGTVSLAAINSPATTVLSGSPSALQRVQNALHEQDRFARWVAVDVASHSPQVDVLRPRIMKALEGINPRPASLPFFSTVTGKRMDDPQLDAPYWMDNLRKPVLFSEAIANLADDGFTSFLELGPHPVLQGAIQQTGLASGRDVRPLPALQRDEPGRTVMLQTLAKWFTEGYPVSWDRLFPSSGRYVSLPPMRWQHQRYWIEPKTRSSENPWHQAESASKRVHPLLGERVDLADNPLSFFWEGTLDPSSTTFLPDHRIGGETVLPAAAYLEMAIQAAREAELDVALALRDLQIVDRMTIREGATLPVQVQIRRDGESEPTFRVYSRLPSADGWKLHATAIFPSGSSPLKTGMNGKATIEATRTRSVSEMPAATFYEILAARGVQYGPAFRAVQRLWQTEGSVLGLVRLPEDLRRENSRYHIHPALLDACFQVLGGLPGTFENSGLFLPIGCERVQWYAPPGDTLWSLATLQAADKNDPDIIKAQVLLFDEQEQLVAEVQDLTLRRVRQTDRSILDRSDTWLYHARWQAYDLPAPATAETRVQKQWVLFADQQGLGEALARDLMRGGDTCHLVPPPPSPNRSSSNTRQSLSSYLDQRLRAISGPLDGVVHMWSLDVDRMPSGEHDPSVSGGQWVSDSILLAVQAISRRPSGSSSFWIVTAGAQPVRSGEPVVVSQSPAWGLGKTMTFELPELDGIRVDLDPQQTEACMPLLRQLLDRKDREDQVAIRDGRFYVPRLLPYQPSASTCDPGFAPRPDATYLITGGLGGLGLATARWLAERGARHLVLLGRRPPLPEAQAVVNQLQAKGVTVLVAQADVSQLGAVKRVIARIDGEMPHLKGIVHAAGVLDDGSLLNLDRDRMRKVMAPKVAGSWNLHRATLGHDLDFFVLYSSAVSVLGSPGQGNYAAASAFLDAMAHFRHHRGLSALSINWGPWAEVGLAAETIERLEAQQTPKPYLVKVIKVEQGLAILEALLATGAPQVMALPFDLKHLIDLYPRAAGMPFLGEVGGKETHVARLYARPNLRQAYVAPRNALERKMAALWRETLHIDRVGIHDSFFELGGDSVLGAQILSMAQKTFGIRINPQDAFKAFTIASLAEMLETRIRQEIEAMSEEEAQQRLSNRD